MIPEIVELAERLKSRADTGRVRLEFPEVDTLRVVPTADDTFALWAMWRDGTWSVGAERWSNDDCHSLENAYNLICWLLTPYYRILESYAGEDPIATWIEVYTDQGWESTDFCYFVTPVDDSPLTGATDLAIIHQAVFLDSSFRTHFPAAHLDQAGYPVGTLLGRTSYVLRDDGWHPIGVPVAE